MKFEYLKNENFIKDKLCNYGEPYKDEDGIKKTKGKYKIIVDREKAIEHALRKATKNDLVLVAGKGHETYQEINGVKHHFDDREVIANILKKLPEVKDEDLYMW